MPRSPKSQARASLLNFQVLFQPEIEHVIEFEQTADLIIYAETSEPLPHTLTEEEEPSPTPE